MSRYLPLVAVLSACSATPAPAPAPPPSPTPAPSPAPAAAPAPAPTPAAARPVSDDPNIVRLVDLGRTDSKVGHWVEYLAGTIGPRLTGSHNLMKAEAWARDQLAAMGLDARLETWGSVPVGFDRGPFSGRMVAPEELAFELTTPAWTPGALGPVRGHAMLYPDTVAAARTMAKQAKGAWIVDPVREDKLDAKLRTKIDAVLSKAGVAGFVHRARDPKGELVMTFGQYRVAWNQLPADTEVYLRGSQHDKVLEHIKAGKEVELEFSIDNRFFNGPVPQYNVVADIKGTEKPDEYVIVGGHLDSWDGAHGAVDNGTGVATTMEAARLLMAAGIKPRRTIRFILWSGEEQGLLGSRAYVEQHAELMDQISAVLIHDGGTNFLSGLAVTPEMAEDMKKIFAPVFGLDPEMPFGLYYAEGLSGFASDHAPFIGAGVPGFFWEQSGKADYEHAHHTQFDNLDAVVPAYQKHSAMVVAIAAYGIANLDHLLDRTDSSPVTPGPPSGVELSGTTLVSVKKGSEMYLAGFRSGDTIVAVNGIKSDDIVTIAREVFSAQGDTVTFKLRRAGKLKTLVTPNRNKAMLAERVARQKRRKARFGEIDYRNAFAGKGTRPKGVLDRLLGGKKRDPKDAKRKGE